MFVTKMSDDVEVRIRFAHFDNEVIRKYSKEKIKTRATKATIEVNHGGDDWEFVSDGVANCIEGDQFSKARGRKNSLATAMKKSYFSHPGRKKLWGVYLAKIGKWTKEFNSEEEK